MQHGDSSGRGRTKVQTTRLEASAAGKSLGEALVAAGSITPEQLEEALRVQRDDPRELGKILLSLGYVTEADMARAVARRLRLEYVHLTERRVDRDVVRLVDQKVLRKHCVVPLRLDGGRLVVATSTPTDFYALEDVAILSGYPGTPVVAAASEIRRVHEKVLAIGNEVAGLLDEAAEERPENGDGDLELASDAGAGNAPMIRLVSAILQQAVAEEASDIHIEPRARELAVRMRVDGVLREAQSLRQQGLLVIDVKEQSVAQKDVLAPFKRVKLADLVIFSRQLATMINAGLPIVRALYVLSEQTENQKLKEVVVLVRKDVEAGLALSEALDKHPEVFGRLYVEMVRAGEIGGILDGVLLRVADQLEKDQELRRKVKSAMTYPTIVLILAVLAASFMLIFIVPVFAKIFEDLGGTLPLPTRVAMGLSDILTSFFGLLLYAGLGVGVFLFLRWIKTEQGRKVWGRVVLRIPAKIGDVVQKVALARFARTLGTLSAAGVPILQAIEITATSSGNWVMEKALLESRDAVREGIPIYKPLEAEPVFPPMVTRMIAVGEETGDVDGMLGKIGDFYESEVDATVKALTSIIEPLMIVIVGGIVGGIIIAMYLPMFKIFELVE